MSLCLGYAALLAGPLGRLLPPNSHGMKQIWPSAQNRCRCRGPGPCHCVCSGGKGDSADSAHLRAGRADARAGAGAGALALQRGLTMTVATKESSSQNEGVKLLLTLVIIEQDGRLLLGMKKRGFGEGFYNGFGGKVEAGETIEEAAARELEEEAGIAAVEMVKRGILTFHFDDKPVPWEVHVFHVREFTGEPCETEEMSPIWFSLADIPYDKMWKDDVIWYPPFLKGHCFRGEFFFQSRELISHSLQIVPVL